MRGVERSLLRLLRPKVKPGFFPVFGSRCERTHAKALNPSHTLPMYMVMCHVPVGVRPFVMGETPVFLTRGSPQGRRNPKSPDIARGKTQREVWDADGHNETMAISLQHMLVVLLTMNVNRV